jgi:hypothetical protein
MRHVVHHAIDEMTVLVHPSSVPFLDFLVLVVRYTNQTKSPPNVQNTSYAIVEKVFDSKPMESPNCPAPADGFGRG